TGATMIASHALHEEESASVKLGTFDFGSSRILHNYYITLGDKAQIDAAHLLYGDAEGQRGNIVVIEHKGEHAHTTQNAKHILKEKAIGIFDALIRVNHTGKYAVTHQNARSVLLDNGAYMVSKPHLDIYIDELEASHGSTTGQLDPAQLFYLQSRGIAREEAKKMLIYAFAKDVIETLGDEAIEKRLIEKFEKRYSGGAA
ncbi:MAG TPA: SufD family Fe-S cluster assembly protein, partial [Epsilonproteobacteria bacterium]|nr:SufD family Fe-S cluster assembly protein [Campylobacterota bacterium]